MIAQSVTIPTHAVSFAADCVFLNFSRPLAQFLPEDPQSPKRIIIAAGPPSSSVWRGTINTGNFFLRTHAWTLGLMTEAVRENRTMNLCHSLRIVESSATGASRCGPL